MAGDTSTRLLGRYPQLSLTSQRLSKNGFGFRLPLRAGAGCRTAEEMAQVRALDSSASCVYFLHLGGGSPTP